MMPGRRWPAAPCRPRGFMPLCRSAGAPSRCCLQPGIRGRWFWAARDGRSSRWSRPRSPISAGVHPEWFAAYRSGRIRTRAQRVDDGRCCVRSPTLAPAAVREPMVRTERHSYAYAVLRGSRRGPRHRAVTSAEQDAIVRVAATSRPDRPPRVGRRNWRRRLGRHQRYLLARCSTRRGPNGLERLGRRRGGRSDGRRSIAATVRAGDAAGRRSARLR